MASGCQQLRNMNERHSPQHLICGWIWLEPLAIERKQGFPAHATRRIGRLRYYRENLPLNIDREFNLAFLVGAEITDDLVALCQEEDDRPEISTEMLGQEMFN